MLRRVVWYKFTDVSEVLTAYIIITLLVDAAFQKTVFFMLSAM
jgi:hypothetical protein